ncbi:C-X-C motif chemokine 10-like isoform X2 [Pempheris klunzingeri]|uniref:C-X-C motif chemokine 10-like isoform X2 n=1 Tax=Pempheris klunzingeri TaxID=3127111 RepID=UPI0039817012
MTTKPLLLLLAALTLCCCITSLQAYPRACLCLRTTSTPIRPQAIEKIEVIPISGKCRRIEIIVTRRNGSRVCVTPTAKWVIMLLSRLQRTACIKGRAFPCVGHQL